MLSFKHPNVMSLIGLCFDGDVPLIIMPFMSDGSLLEYVRRNRQHFYLTQQSSQDKVTLSTHTHLCVQCVYSQTVVADFLWSVYLGHRQNVIMKCVIAEF